MSNYLGFEPILNHFYYFVSYNNNEEDIEKIKPIVVQLFHDGLPIWYDKALTYGELWEEEISEKLHDAQAVIMFLSQKTFQKEYRIAKRKNKKIVTVLLDEIDEKNILSKYDFWWDDISQRQAIIAYGDIPVDSTCAEIKKSLGVENEKLKQDSIFFAYQQYLQRGETDKAKEVYDAYIFDVSLEAKAQLMKHILMKSPYCPLFKESVEINGNLYEIDWEDAYHSWGQSKERFYVIKDHKKWIVISLIESNNGKLYYNSIEDCLYVSFYSQPLNFDDDFLSLIVISNFSSADFVIHTYMDEEILKTYQPYASLCKGY